MARTTGSDHLYQLIHSLTTEEKGYFIKFARRYSSSGNASLQLFKAISKQKVFEEKSLKEKIKSYPVVKVYLKNMITDSLALYHRSNHPHIELLSQIQKIHVLVQKGMQAEALKNIEKAIAEAERIEVFVLVIYLLKIKRSILFITLKSAPLLQDMHAKHLAKLNEVTFLEADLADWEKIMLDLFIAMRSTDTFRPEQSNDDKISSIIGKQVFSKRSELMKINALCYFYRATMDEKELYDISKKLADTSSEFRLKIDRSYDDIEAISNYLLTLGHYGKMKERISESEKMFNQPRFDLSQKHEVLIRYLLHKSSALLHLGRAREASQLLAAHEKSFYAAVASIGDYIKQEVFVQQKILSYFLNCDYAAAWREIQLFSRDHDPGTTNVFYADLKMMEIMIQFMLGNYDLVRSMAAKYKKEFAIRNVQSYTYQMLFKFFTTKSPLEYKREARKVLDELNAYYASEKKFARKINADIYLSQILSGCVLI